MLWSCNVGLVKVPTSGKLSEEHTANLAIWTKKDFIIKEALGLTVSCSNCKKGAEILKNGELYYSREGGQGTS